MTNNDKNNFDLHSNWGMPRGFYSPTKYYGIPIAKAGFLAMVFIGCLQLNGTVFPPDQPGQFLLCTLLIMLLALYLILPSKSGGSNANAVWYFHVKRKKRYFSIDRNVYPQFQFAHQKRKTSGKK